MLHFTQDEFARRRAALMARLSTEGLDGILLFAPESQYWLTGFDTFGYCFFQCLVVTPQEMVLLTRSADLRQAQLTSTLQDIRVWADGADAAPAQDLARLVAELGLDATRLGVETDTHGLTAWNGARLVEALPGLVEASALVPDLRLTKSEEEIAYIRHAAWLGDQAFEEALPLMRPGVSEAAVLAAMQGAVLGGGGDYPGNPFIVGAGDHALLCRYQSGRKLLTDQDQLTLEWAGVYRHYHAALMRTVVLGPARAEHGAMHAACHAALLACEAQLTPDTPMGAAYEAHARTLSDHGFAHAKLNACGYALGARFAPSWMERQMFFENAPTPVAPGQVYFLHMILMDSDTGAAMSLGRTSLVTETGAEPLSALPLEMVHRS